MKIKTILLPIMFLVSYSSYSWVINFINEADADVTATAILTCERGSLCAPQEIRIGTKGSTQSLSIDKCISRIMFAATGKKGLRYFDVVPTQRSAANDMCMNYTVTIKESEQYPGNYSGESTSP